MRLGWEPPPVDPEHAAAESHDVHRSTSRASDGYRLLANAPSTEHVDVGAARAGEAPLHFYLIVARNACGTSGDQPSP